MAGFTETEELIILRRVAAKIENAGIDNVSPSPIEFVDKAEALKNFGIAATTQKLIETTPIVFSTIDWLDFKDDALGACVEEPVIKLAYGIHHFREVTRARSVPADDPDTFLRKMLESDRLMKQEAFAIRREFLGLTPITGLPSGWYGWITSVTMPQFKKRGPGKYLNAVEGFGADLQVTVEVVVND